MNLEWIQVSEGRNLVSCRLWTEDLLIVFRMGTEGLYISKNVF